ncbi:MAG: ABC transporter permease, partial [Staphylococcus epidermidis]|nr:ABC transporter permease [Staphylococcus epidermidis]
MIVLRRLFQDRGAIFAIAIITIYVVLGVLAPLITFYEPNHIDTANKFAGISWSHWLGTDHLGRDVLTRIIYAIRPSLLYVFVALIISVVIGAILGFIWAWFCRVIRTSVMQYIEADHVKFAKVIGMNDLTIIRKHILPLTFTDIAIIASSSMCSMILQMSGFSFLGLGVKAPTAEWGMMLNEARKVMFTHPGMMMTTGVAIVIIVMAFNFLSDALQMAIDPRMS